MKQCPMNGKECIGIDCSWWFDDFAMDRGRCVIWEMHKALKDTLDDVSPQEQGQISGA